MGTSVKPLSGGGTWRSSTRGRRRATGRGLHSSTFWLNLSAFGGIEVHGGVVEKVRRKCQGVLRSLRGCLGCILCRKRLKLS